MKMKAYYSFHSFKKVYNLFWNNEKRGYCMLEGLFLLLLSLPIVLVLINAFIASKDYYDYDSKKCRYVSRIIK